MLNTVFDDCFITTILIFSRVIDGLGEIMNEEKQRKKIKTITLICSKISQCTQGSRGPYTALFPNTLKDFE